VSLKATITDSEALKKITPQQLKTYLRAHGWSFTCVEERRRLLVARGWEYWRNSADSSSEVIIPTEGCADYSSRMAETMHLLAFTERRSQLDIYCELVGKPTYEELEAAVQAAAPPSPLRPPSGTVTIELHDVHRTDVWGLVFPEPRQCDFCGEVRNDVGHFELPSYEIPNAHPYTGYACRVCLGTQVVKALGIEISIRPLEAAPEHRCPCD
jgi:hypothetical protein